MEHVPLAPTRVTIAAVAALTMAFRGKKHKSLSSSGAIAAVIVGFLCMTASYSWGLVLIAFFVSSSKLTKIGAERKRKLEDGYAGGQRTWVQVFANGGFGALLAAVSIYYVGLIDRGVNFSSHPLFSWLTIAYLGHFSCCNGDTWSSEVGILSSSKPILLTTLKRVYPGTNGAISLLGTSASALGGLFIGLVYWTVNQFTAVATVPQWPIIVVCGMSGLMGSLLDSLLGATLQYSAFDPDKQKVVGKQTPKTVHISGLDVLDNHMVNFLSASMTGIIAALICSRVLA